MKSPELENPLKKQSKMNGTSFIQAPDANAATTPVASPETIVEVQRLLDKIPADDYSTWFEVSCVLKHLGIPYEIFRDWSATSDKFDEDECAQKWEDLPDEPRAGWPTLRKHAGMASFVPVPDQMRPEPQTEDECAAQAARYLATSFKAGEEFEICGWKEDPTGKRLVPARSTHMNGLDADDTEETLRDDDTLRSWVQDGILGGVVVGLNPVKVPPDFKGYAPSDEMVSDYHFGLLESDNIPVEEQWSKLNQMHLPIASAVHSGGKSLHIRCFIDAGNDLKLYKERMDKLINYANSFGFDADKNCRNASRLTRLPGAMRNGKRQYTVCWSCGYPDWATFEMCELGSFNITATPTASSTKETASQIQHDRATNAEAPCTPEDQILLDELEAEFGEPLTFSSKGMVVGVNEPYWAAFVMRKRGLIKISGIIWRYAPTTGLWLRVSAEELNNLIAKTAREYGAANSINELATKFNEPTCNHVRKFMKNATANPFQNRPRNIIHVGNGVVEIAEDGTCVLKPFSTDFYSQNQCVFDYNPDAQCPRFMSELLVPMLPDDDIEVLQLYCGQCLLGINLFQKFLLLTGTPGGGKGTLVSIIRAIVGEANSVELRTEHLGERFELVRFIGKSLLIGSDVPSEFLLYKTAGKVKSLCGWDLLSAEVKGLTESVPLIGNFNMIITANSRLRVNVDGDTGAWKRRMLWIPYEMPETQNPISDFAGVLLREEGPGILNWMVQGAAKLLQQVFPNESLSSKRVERLLQESNSIYGFLTTCIENNDGEDISVDELVTHYDRWCKTNDWEPLWGLEARRKLTRGVESLFHVPQVHNIVRDSRNLRGYHGVAFKADTI